ncbi:MAG: formate/nitrite transporter family protein [Gammaproteobacteria bacterium]|nr:formate/nitrite transporter family protein [Gammaproteobacteria bacterium]
MQSSQNRGNSPRRNPNDRGERGERGDRNTSHRPQGGSGRPPYRRHNRPSNNIAYEIIQSGTRRIGGGSYILQLLLSLLGGGLMAVAAVVALQLAGTAENPVWQQVALSFGFTAGLFLVLASNSILFTEVNILVPSNLYGVKVGSGFIRLFVFWILAWIGNYFGVLLGVTLLIIAGTHFTPSAASVAVVKSIASLRLLSEPNGPMFGMIPLFVSGILANWVMGIATFFATYNRVAMGKILCLLFGVAVITLANLQYFPINVALLAVAQMSDPSLNMWHIVINHLVPISLGNLVGGAFLVSIPLLMQIRRPNPKASS